MLITFILYTGLAILFAKIIKRSSGMHVGILVLICIAMALFSAFRGEAGTDSWSYRNIYEMPSAYFVRTDVEIGYKILMYLCNRIRLPYVALFFIMSFFTSFFFLLAIREERNDIDIETAFLVYFFDFYLASFNTMRQSLAISLCMYGIIKWVKREYKIALPVLGLAMLFHYPSIISFVLLIYIAVLRTCMYKVAVIISVATVTWMINNIEYAIEFAGYLTNGGHYQTFFYGMSDNTKEGIILYLIKIAPIFLFALWARSRYKNSERIKIYLGVMILGYAVSLLGEVYTTYVERLGFYMSCFRIILLGYCANDVFKIQFSKYNGCILGKKTAKAAILAYVFVVYYYSVFVAGSNNLVPYGVL